MIECPSPAAPPSDYPQEENVPAVACPLCGQIDTGADQEWLQEERQRLEAYTKGQLDLVRLQREDFLKHRSEVESALALHGQELNRKIRQVAALASRISQRDQEFTQREQACCQGEAELTHKRERLAAQEHDFTTQQTTLTLREQAAAEREAETARRETELTVQQERLAQAQVEVVKLQAEQEALRQQSEQLGAEHKAVKEAIQAAGKQLASLEEEYSRRAASLVQREEAAPRREPVAYVQEPVAPRPQPAPPAPRPTDESARPFTPITSGNSQTGMGRPTPASSTVPGTTRRPADVPVPASASSPGATRATPVASPASGSAAGTAPRPVTASGSAPGLLRQPTAAPASPSARGGTTEEHRGAQRRRGNPVSVQITNDLRNAESWPGWVVDRSPDGLCLLTDEPAEIGSLLNVRPTKAGPSARWIQVAVRSCSSERSSWKIGCQFQAKLTWDDLQYFG